MYVPASLCSPNTEFSSSMPYTTSKHCSYEVFTRLELHKPSDTLHILWSPNEDRTQLVGEQRADHFSQFFILKLDSFLSLKANYWKFTDISDEEALQLSAKFQRHCGCNFVSLKSHWPPWLVSSTWFHCCILQTVRCTGVTATEELAIASWVGPEDWSSCAFELRWSDKQRWNNMTSDLWTKHISIEVAITVLGWIANGKLAAKLAIVVWQLVLAVRIWNSLLPNVRPNELFQCLLSTTCWSPCSQGNIQQELEFPYFCNMPGFVTDIMHNLLGNYCCRFALILCSMEAWEN